MRDVRRIRAALLAAGESPLVLATVLRTRGPAYRRAGAMALLAADGRLLAGGVSAGCLESDVSARTPAVLKAGAAERVVYDADGGAFAIPSGCGGTVEVLLEPVTTSEHREALAGWLRAAESLGAVGACGIVLRGRSDGRGGFARVIATTDGEWWFNAAGSEGFAAAARAAVRRDGVRAAALRSAGVFRYDGLEVAWHPLSPVPVLVIGGAMPDAEPVARLAQGLDWRVRVLDHREARLDGFGVPEIEREAGPPESLAARVGADPFTAVLVMYHAEAADGEALRALVAAPPGFVGVLGPRSRTARLLAGTPLAEPPWPSWLRAPVGLDVGADTPDEIAVSIVGELLAWQRGAGGAPLVGRDGPLHHVGAFEVLEGDPAPWPGDGP